MGRSLVGIVEFILEIEASSRKCESVSTEKCIMRLSQKDAERLRAGRHPQANIRAMFANATWRTTSLAVDPPRCARPIRTYVRCVVPHAAPLADRIGSYAALRR
jgi:hypothetical protein